MSETRILEKKILSIQLDLKAPKNQYNSFGKYHYRNAEDILEALKPLLHREGIFLFFQESINWETKIMTVLLSIGIAGDVNDGYDVCGYAYVDFDQKGMTKSQAIGAASSYAKKYALGNLFLIDDGKDDDSKEPSKPGLSSDRFKKALGAFERGDVSLEDIEARYTLTQDQKKEFEKLI